MEALGMRYASNTKMRISTETAIAMIITSPHSRIIRARVRGGLGEGLTGAEGAPGGAASSERDSVAGGEGSVEDCACVADDCDDVIDGSDIRTRSGKGFR